MRSWIQRDDQKAARAFPRALEGPREGEALGLRLYGLHYKHACVSERDRVCVRTRTWHLSTRAFFGLEPQVQREVSDIY